MNLLMDKNELVNSGIKGMINNKKTALIELLCKQKEYGKV